MNFHAWEESTRKQLGISHDAMTDLAFTTLELCLDDLKTIDDFDVLGSPYQCGYESEYKISENRYAKLDYIAFIYFLFRSYLCQCESRSFVEEHDILFQRLLSYYAITILGISAESARELLQKRFVTYDKVVSEKTGDVVIHLTNEFIIYLERDLIEIPLGDEYPVISIFKPDNLATCCKAFCIVP